MTTNIWKYFKVTFIIIFYFLFNSIFTYVLKLFKIDLANFSDTNLIISIASEFLLAFILFLIYRKDIVESVKDYKNNFKEYFRFGMKWWLIGVIVMVASNMIINFFYTGGSTNENLVSSLIKVLPLYMFISAVITGPFGEEIIFRRSLREIFTNNILYVIVCGLFFGFVHIHILAANNTINTMEMLFIIPYGALGCAFAYIYVKTKNIVVPISFHMIHNFILVSFYIINMHVLGA